LALEAALAAKSEILSVYKDNLKFEVKKDGSPLTVADKRSHNVINSILLKSGIPIVSEEGNSLLLNEDSYWLVDPLDGTKDFLDANDEFTINIALIRNKNPILGIVSAPALDELYVGSIEECSYVVKRGKKSILKMKEKSQYMSMAVSRFHDHPDVDKFAEMNNIDKKIQMGSALKLCRLAAGEADVYPRLVGSSEWDISAGQAVLEASCGFVFNWDTGKELTYGKINRRNPRLLSVRNPYRFKDFDLINYKKGIL